MKGDFVEEWEGKSEGELFSAYIETVVVGVETGLHKRRSAARILARRKHQPTGKVLTEWLNEPKKGIGKIEYNEWGTATSPPNTYYSDDADEWQIIHLATESLGLMGCELECQQTRSALEELLYGDKYKGHWAETDIKKLVAWALRRIDEPNEPEIEMEDDMLLYIAAIARPDLFREKGFKGLANQMISTHGREVTKRYIEALRKVPDICVKSGKNDCFFDRSIITLVGHIGTQYGEKIQEFEIICKELFNIVKDSKGFDRGVSHTTITGFQLYDGSSATINDGVKMTVREYVDRISQQRYI